MNRTILGNELENLNRSETVKPFFKSNRPKKLCVLGIAVKKFIENIIYLKHHFEKYNVEQLIVRNTNNIQDHGLCCRKQIFQTLKLF